MEQKWLLYYKKRKTPYISVVPSAYKSEIKIANHLNVKKSQTQQWVLLIMYKNINKEC